MKRAVFFLAVMFLFANLFADDDATKKKIYVARPVNPHPPAIDGRLDDPVWEKAEWKGDFTQRRPDDGAAPSQKTEFKVMYDEKNLYFAIRAHDTEPDKIVRRVTRRDRFDGDMVEVNIDSYFDHRTAFSFTINAAGVRGDEAISNDGDNWDGNWDPVWFGEVAVDDRGWTAEMKIPFSQLRFANREEHVWGLQVMRQIYRKDERSHWQYIPKNSGGWVSYFGELHGIKGISASRRIELLPYGVSDLRKSPKIVGDPFATGQKTKFSGGLDAKVAVTSDLTLDVTVNPDFGQVEADPSEVNLTAFETFFEEKRPFFIEGQNILDYRLMSGNGGFANDRLFYSRRIGRRPQHSPDLLNEEDEKEYAKVPDNSSIITAMKLTGKTKNGLSIGVLDAVTAKEDAIIDLNGDRRHETVEPLTNYFLGRLQKDYNNGNTSIGGAFTALNRNLSHPSLNFLNKAAYSGGVDFRHQWKDKTYYLDVKTAFSHIRGDQLAIYNAQSSSARYLQRPDADYVERDSSRTSLSGHGGFVNIGRGGTNRLRANVGGMWRSPGLELNDMGFLRQADRILQWSWVGYNWNKPFAVFRSLRFNLNQWAGWNWGGENLFTGGNFNGGGQLNNYWWFWLGGSREGGGLSTTALRGGPALKTTGEWNNWYNISSDNRKFLQFGAGGFNSWSDEGNSRTHNVRFWVRLQRDALRLSINPFYTFRKSNLQYINTVTKAYDAIKDTTVSIDDQYVFGLINQKTFGITIRLDFSLTPDLSIQYYGQPFASAGKYSEIKRITDTPRANRYEDRFHVFNENEIAEEQDGTYTVNVDGNPNLTYGVSPNFNFRQFRSNLVIRWEYNPGSTLFLVWTQERTGFDDHGNFSLGNERRKLFDADATNVFLIKVSRWFSL